MTVLRRTQLTKSWEPGVNLGRRHVGLIPSARRHQGRVCERPVEVGPDPRLMFEILRLAVAAVEPSKGAEQPRVALSRHDGIVRREVGRVKILAGYALCLDVAGE